MAASVGRHKSRSAGAVRRAAGGRIAHHEWQGAEKALTLPLFTDDILVQFQALGLSPNEAARFLDAVRTALGSALDGLDASAWMTAPIAEQVSMLLPRFDVARLARTCRLSRAEVQSALALLVLGFVTITQHAHH